MGSGSSRTASASGGFKPSPPGGAAERKISKSGYDITPLTQDEIKKLSLSLTPFQRYDPHSELACGDSPV